MFAGQREPLVGRFKPFVRPGNAGDGSHQFLVYSLMAQLLFRDRMQDGRHVRERLFIIRVVMRFHIPLLEHPGTYAFQLQLLVQELGRHVRVAG